MTRWEKFCWRTSARLQRVFVVTAMAGFDIGLIVHSWRRYGPVLFWREMNVSLRTEDNAGPWRVAIFLSRRAFEEFYEGAFK